MRLLRMVWAVVFGVAFAVPDAVAQETVPLTGVLRSHQGEVLPGVTIRGYRRIAPGWQVLTTITRPDGTFSLTVRQYVIEKSVDMERWEPVATVALDGFGRLEVRDESSALEPFCLYRAVETTPVIISR